MERSTAWIFVASLHLIVVWIITRPLPMSAETSPPLELVFIRLAPPPLEILTRPHRKRLPAPADPLPAKRLRAQLEVASREVTTPATPLPITAADDRWDAAAPTYKDDAVRITRNKLTDSFNPIQAAAPERFRMRGQLSPADFVRAVAKELFWPAGYTDDPCGGIEKAVQMLTGGSSRREHELLVDAIEQQQRYCR